MVEFLALLGLGVSLISWLTGKKQQEEAAELQREQDILGLEATIADWETQLAGGEVGIAEAEFGINIMELALERFPEYAAFEKSKLQAAGEQEYRALMENFANLNVLAGATGRGGPDTAMGVLAGRARSDIETFVGEDLTFDVEGGLYGQAWSQLTQNLEAERLTYEGQLDVYETSLNALVESQEILEAAVTVAETQLEEWKAPAPAPATPQRSDRPEWFDPPSPDRDR